MYLPEFNVNNINTVAKECLIQYKFFIINYYLSLHFFWQPKYICMSESYWKGRIDEVIVHELSSNLLDELVSNLQLKRHLLSCDSCSVTCAADRAAHIAECIPQGFHTVSIHPSINFQFRAAESAGLKPISAVIGQELQSCVPVIGLCILGICLANHYFKWFQKHTS